MIAANPMMLVVTTVATGIALIITYWDKIKTFFGWVSYAFGLTDEKPTDKKKSEKSENDIVDSTTIMDAVTNGKTEPVAKLPEIKKVDPTQISQDQKAQSQAASAQNYKYANQIPATTNKTVNVTISNFTVNAQNIDEALPKIVDRVREAIRQGVKEDMENSYAY